MKELEENLTLHRKEIDEKLCERIIEIVRPNFAVISLCAQTAKKYPHFMDGAVWDELKERSERAIREIELLIHEYRDNNTKDDNGKDIDE